jgi:hypothetical protein
LRWVETKFAHNYKGFSAICYTTKVGAIIAIQSWQSIIKQQCGWQLCDGVRGKIYGDADMNLERSNDEGWSVMDNPITLEENNSRK